MVAQKIDQIFRHLLPTIRLNYVHEWLICET